MTVPEVATEQVPPGLQTLDTVSAAAEDPDREQPWAELGLKDDEYARIREILGRRPTSSELAMYGDVERALLLQVLQGASPAVLRDPAETPIGKLLAGIGENAGVIDIGQGYAVTFKIESHNHPSTSSPTRARPPVSVASSATSWPWAPGRSP